MTPYTFSLITRHLNQVHRSAQPKPAGTCACAHYGALPRTCTPRLYSTLHSTTHAYHPNERDGSAATHSWPGRPPFVACRQRGGVRSSSSVPTRPAQPRKQEGNEEHAAVDAIVQCRAVYFRLHMYGFLRSVGEVSEPKRSTRFSASHLHCPTQS